jgi:hypothetical protein
MSLGGAASRMLRTGLQYAGFDVCLCVVVVVVVGLLVVCFVEDELLSLPPQPARATVAASAATSVSMAVSGVLLIVRAPIFIVVRRFGRSPYQAFAAPIAVAR